MFYPLSSAQHKSKRRKYCFSQINHIYNPLTSHALLSPHIQNETPFVPFNPFNPRMYVSEYNGDTSIFDINFQHHNLVLQDIYINKITNARKFE